MIFPILNIQAQFSEEDQLLQQRLNKLSEEITELINAHKKAHNIHKPSRASSNGFRKATMSTSSLELVADQPQKAHSSEPMPNAKAATLAVGIPKLTLSYSTSSEVDILCDLEYGNEAKGKEMERLSLENTGLPIIELNTSSNTTEGKRRSLGSSGSDFSACVATEPDGHDHTHHSSNSSLAEDIDDVFVES